MIEAPESISVVICTYSRSRWSDLVDAVESVRAQRLPVHEVVVVVDHDDALLEDVRREFDDVIAVPNAGARGASGSRNSGVRSATGGIIAFLDDDAVASRDWSVTILEGLRDERVLGVGSGIEPLWKGDRPAWFPEEFYWVVGATYRGLPEVTAPVRNLWTNNMAVRREVFDSIGGFRDGFGKVGTVSSPEDTDFCIRALQRWPDRVWLHMPYVTVGHKVPAARSSFRYFTRRCYNEGVGKARLARLVGTTDATSAERRHALRTLPRGVIREMVGAVRRRDVQALLRAGAIVAGFGAVAAGYGLGWVRSRSTDGEDG